MDRTGRIRDVDLDQRRQEEAPPWSQSIVYPLLCSLLLTLFTRLSRGSAISVYTAAAQLSLPSMGPLCRLGVRMQRWRRVGP